jgi:NADH-quinone oxidoreductase subunit M
MVLIPVVAGALALRISARDDRWGRWVCVLALTVNLALCAAVWFRYFRTGVPATGGLWTIEFNQAWIPQLGIRFHLALDGLSLLLVALTNGLGLASVAASWTEIRERTGLFHLTLMWVLAATIGVFLAVDLFLFYFFWEMMLVPMYFLIALWGHERRVYAAIKFFLFTQASGLLMIIAIVGLYLVHGRDTGTYTFDYQTLLGTHMSGATAALLMLGFVAAFAVKLPIVPFHTWLPDAHTEAPTAGSVVLAGLLLKTGAYGLLRFVVPLFPNAAFDFQPYAMALAVVGILYGALLAFGQTDIKRLVAYTSVSHMGFVLLGIFAWNDLALQGAVIQILCHGLATGALFVIAGLLQERTHTRDMRRLQGLWSAAPRMGGTTLFFALAAMGLPGLGNFVGEFLVLIGTYPHHPVATALAGLGLISSTTYGLWLVQRVFHGPNLADWQLPDLSRRECATTGVLALGIVWLGLYPQPVINVAHSALTELQTTVRVERSAQSSAPHIEGVSASTSVVTPDRTPYDRR